MSNKKWTLDTDPSAYEQRVCNNVFKTTLNEESDMNGLAEIQSSLGSCTEIGTKLEISIYACANNKKQPKEDLREAAFLCVAGDHVSGFFPTTKYRKNIPRSCFGELIKARSLC